MRRALFIFLFTACGSFFQQPPTTDAGTDVDAGTVDAGLDGTSCTSGVVCQNAMSGLECRAGTWVAFPCRGPGGCMSFSNGPTCDFNGALAGDHCPLDVEGRRACTVTGRGVIECRSGTFVETLSCSSCTLANGVVTCTP